MGKEMNPSYAFTEVDANGLLHFFCDAGSSRVALGFNGMSTKPGMILLISLTATLPLLQNACAVHGGKLTATGTQETMPDKPNSFRHRGYVYDEESSRDYMRSRYYNPADCRFINAVDTKRLCNDSGLVW